MTLLLESDPIPKAAYRLKRGAFTAKIIFLTGVVVSFYVPFWILKVYVAFFTIQFAGNLYLKSLCRDHPVDSLLDFSISLVVNLIKLTILFNILWGMYNFAFQQESFYKSLLDTAERFIYLDEFLIKESLNPVNLAFIFPLLSPTYNFLRSFIKNKSLADDIQAADEVRIDGLLKKTEKYYYLGRYEESRKYFDMAIKLLDKTIENTNSPEIAHNRKLRREYLLDKYDFRGGKRTAASDRGVVKYDSSNARSSLDIPGVDFSIKDETLKSSSNLKGKDEDNEHRKYIFNLIQKSDVKWDQIVGLDDIIREVKLIFGLSLARGPEGVTIDPGGSLLLYGPPGTGKTLLAAAGSSELDATFFNVQVSNVLSKFFGESTKILSEIFEAAREQAPSVIFFDEIESLCPGRDSAGIQGEEKRLISTFLSEMDGLKQKGTKAAVFIIAATNLPWQIDNAIMSRFEKSFYIPNPNRNARRKMFEILLEDKGFRTDVSLDKISAHTNGYSGREISQLCREMTRLMLQRANPDLDNKVRQGRQAVEQYQLKAMPITLEEVNQALSKIRPKTTEDILSRYEDFQDKNS